jgi:hypothetical protein
MDPDNHLVGPFRCRLIILAFHPLSTRPPTGITTSVLQSGSLPNPDTQGDALDPHGKIPELKFCAVRIEPAAD